MGDNTKTDHSTILGFDTNEQVILESIVGLTVVYHPDISRVGEISPLVGYASGKHCLLSRHEPFFVQPYGNRQKALETGFMSRTPILFEAPHDGGISMKLQKAIPLLVDGIAATEVNLFDFQELTKGVVLTFGRGVVLLLHFLDKFALQPEAREQPGLGLVGQSRAMRQLRADIVNVANLEIPVLLQGESGVGKELVARAIHDQSDRSNKAYVCINMAAIPSTLAARELFGADVGAHADAKKFHPGYFIRAHEGTLFMDEIGDTADEVQPLLLRAVETGQIQVLGSNKLANVDVRLIAATDSKLDRAVVDGSFKLPLLQRLAGYEINIPPLRERADDIGRLFFHFLEQELKNINESFRLDEPASGQLAWLPASLVSKIAIHNWPGNVRQLRNTARQLAIANRGEPSFRTNVALDRLFSIEQKATVNVAVVSPKSKNKRASSAISDETIIQALREHDFIISATASYLGVSRTWLFSRMDNCARIRKASDVELEEIEQSLEQHGNDIDTTARTLEVSNHGLKQRMKQLGISRPSRTSIRSSAPIKD